MTNFCVKKSLEEFFVPLDYLTLSNLHDSNPFSCEKYSDEVLLYLYYSHMGDGLQMLSAHHLFIRGWRYNVKTSRWFTLTSEQFKTINAIFNSKKPINSIFDDTFWYFNIFKWRMDKIEMTIDYKNFENTDVYVQHLTEAAVF